MHARYYIIQAESQEIVLQKNSINPALYWGQHMALESLEKASLANRTTCFTRPTPPLENPYAGINRLPNSLQPHIQRTAPAADPHNVFRPLLSTFNQHQMNINLKRKFRGMKKNQTKYQNNSFDCSRHTSAVGSNNSMDLGSKEETQYDATFFLTNKEEIPPPIVKTHAQTQTKPKLRPVTPDTFKFPKNLKNQSFEGFLREVNIKLQEYEPIMQPQPKSNSRPKSMKARPKYTLVDMTKNITPIQDRRRTPTPSDRNAGSPHSIKRESRQMIGGLRPFSIGSQRRSGDTKNDGINTLISSTELDSLDEERNSPSGNVSNTHTIGKEPLPMKNILLVSEIQSFPRAHSPTKIQQSPKRNAKSQERKNRTEINHTQDMYPIDEVNEKERLRPKSTAEPIRISEYNISHENPTAKRASFVRKKYSREMIGGRLSEKDL